MSLVFERNGLQTKDDCGELQPSPVAHSTLIVGKIVEFCCVN